jgi:hypothetical protein
MISARPKWVPDPVRCSSQRSDGNDLLLQYSVPAAQHQITNSSAWIPEIVTDLPNKGPMIRLSSTLD